jgi:hypothetical protein
MQAATIILFGLAILAFVFFRTPEKCKSAWQNLLGVVAFILALLIIMNPEFLALGLLGDAAFFDVLVLLLSLQLQTFAVRASRCVRSVFSSTTGWLRIPSPRMSYVLVISTISLYVGTVVSAIHKVVHRISS